MARPRLGGEEHHGDVPQKHVGLDLPADVVSAHFWHLHVQEHQVRRALAELIHGLLAVMGHDNLIIGAAQGVAKHQHHRVFIIGYQDNGFGRRGHAHIATCGGPL